jgi:DNA primase
MMVFDLDPDEGMDLAVVRQGVRDIRSILEQLSLKSYLKTSGGKGYHVVVPSTPARLGFVLRFCQARRRSDGTELARPL